MPNKRAVSGQIGLSSPRTTAERVRALRAAKSLSAAAMLCQQELAAAPDNIELHALLGEIYLDMGRAPDAIRHLERASDDTREEPAHNLDLARAYFAAGRRNDGVEHCNRILSASPGSPALQLRIAKLLQQFTCLNEAAPIYRDVIRSLPSNAEAHMNYGNCLSGLGRVEESETELRCAIELRPNYAEAHNSLGMLLLSLGRFEAAWRELDWRWQTKRLSGHQRLFGHPQWNGEDLGESKLLVWLEQGIGDEIFYACVLPYLVSRGISIEVETDPRLATLMRRSFPHINIFPRTDPPHPATKSPDIAYEIAIGSLWCRFQSDRTGQQMNPYLTADPERVELIANRIAQDNEDRLKIGFAWFSKNPRSGRRRSIPLTQWIPIFKATDCKFVSVQYGENAGELENVRRQFGIDILELKDIDVWHDLDGLAALLSALDLVISIDNSTVHMAGALGVPTWVFLARHHDPRWLRDGIACPWYPTIRLFRQQQDDEWQGLIDRVAIDLSDPRNRRFLRKQ